MVEVILWTAVFTAATVISILLMGSRAIVGGQIDAARMLAIFLDWHFLVGAGFALVARMSFVMVNNSLLKIPDLAGGATTITAFITSIALIFVVLANVLFLDERLTMQQIVGAAVILIGIVVISLPGR